MEIIIVILVVFAVSSWVKGISSQSTNNDGSNPRGNMGGGYTRTGSRADERSQRTNTTGDYQKNAMGRTQEQVDYQKVTTRNDNVRELEARLAKSLKNLTGEQLRSAERNYAKTPGSRNTSRNARSNNSPLNKSQFGNHGESNAALRDEIQESTMLWHENMRKMNMINLEFQRFMDQQHADQRKWMRDAQSMDR